MLTRPVTATSFSLRLRLHYKAAHVGVVSPQWSRMKLSLIAAVSENGVIGSGLDIPWSVKGEQLLFKATTYNQWLIVGRKTFESMGKLPNRKYAVITRSELKSDDKDVFYFHQLIMHYLH